MSDFIIFLCICLICLAILVFAPVSMKSAVRDPVIISEQGVSIVPSSNDGRFSAQVTRSNPLLIFSTVTLG